MKLDRITLAGEGVTLSGLLYTPALRSHKPVRSHCLVLAHGFTASKESLDVLAGYLCQRGYPCLTFDFRGHKLGGSTGDLHSMQEAIDDLHTAVEGARRHFGLPQCVLIGHSMGALVSVAAASQREDIAGVAVIAVGHDPLKGFSSIVGQAMLSLRGDYVTGMAPLELLRQLGELVPLLERLHGIPSLFAAAKTDVLVKPEQMRHMAARAGESATFVEIEGGHLEAPDRARSAVAEWLEKTFG